MFVLPLAAHRFKVMPEEIGQNVERFSFDFVKKVVHLEIRATIDADDFAAAYRMLPPVFQATAGNDSQYFTIRMVLPKLIQHQIEFAYENAHHAIHKIAYSFSEITIDDTIPAFPPRAKWKVGPDCGSDSTGLTFVDPETAVKNYNSN